MDYQENSENFWEFREIKFGKLQNLGNFPVSLLHMKWQKRVYKYMSLFCFFVCLQNNQFYGISLGLGFT